MMDLAMRVGFYLDHAERVDVEEVLNGSVATSGSVASVSVFSILSQMHKVTLYHRLNSRGANLSDGGLRLHHVADWRELVRAVQVATTSGKKLDFLIVRNHPDLEPIVMSLRGSGVRIVAMLNNDLDPTTMMRLSRNGVVRFVVRCRESIEHYSSFAFAPLVELVPHSLPHQVATENQSPRLPNRVLWVGATREEKGFHHLLKAWPLVRASCPEAELDVLGSIGLHDPTAKVGSSGVMTPGFEQRHLAPLLQRHGALSNLGIRLHGSRPKAEVQTLASRATVGVVNPNVRRATETFCISAVELQASGCPCIGGAAGGLRDTIMHGHSGLLVATERPSDLAHAITQILTDRSLQSRLSAGARLHAARFLDLNEEADRWAAVLKRSASGAASPDISHSPAARLLRRSGSITLAKISGRVRRTIRSLTSLQTYSAY